MNHDILIFILLFEMALFFLFAIAIVIHRIALFFSRRIKAKRKGIISAFLLDLMQGQQPFEPCHFPGRPFWDQEILEVLDVCNRRFQGEDWERLKRAVAQTYLLLKARKWAGHLLWTKRNFAARSFALCPLQEDERKILALMEDRKFLVRSVATVAAIRMASKKGVRKALIALQRESGYSHFFYRDALLQGSEQVISQLMEMGSDPLLHEACLDVLAAKTWSRPIPFLREDLQNKNPKWRLLALCVLIKNPLPDCSDLFMCALTDPEEQIRIQAVLGLASYPPLGGLDPLEAALSDPSWLVRIGAVRALKKVGTAGVKILSRQKIERARQAITYVEQLG